MARPDYRRRVPFLVLLVITALFLFNMHNKRTGTKEQGISLLANSKTSYQSVAFPERDPPARIIDCFLFNNELDMLEFRLKTLDPVVDIFVISEAKTTFSGRPKDLFFEQNRKRYEPYLHKIRHVIIEDPKKQAGAWQNEATQRDTSKEVLATLEPSLNPYDLILHMDVDEVPDPRTLQALKNHGVLRGVYYLGMDLYYFSFRYKTKDEWRYPKIVDVKTFLKESTMTFTSLREMKAPLVPLRGGWHMSYFGDVEFIRTKLNSFSHQNFNTPQINNPEHIQAAIENGHDLFGRANIVIEKIEPEDNPYLPEHYMLLHKT